MIKMKTKTSTILVSRLIHQIMNIKAFKLIHHTFSMMQRERSTQGFKHAIKHIKQMRLHVTRYICGKPLLTNDVYVGLDKTGWPTRLSHLKPLTETVMGLRVLMTLLTFTKSWVPNSREKKKLVPDYSVITNPSTVKKSYTIPVWFIKEFVAKYDMQLELPEYEDSDHYISTKMSPNGPSTVSSIWSWRSLTSKSRESIEYFLSDYYDRFTEWWESVEDLPVEGEISVDHSGKLAIREDPEGKMRIIAMVDYHSQFVLKKIHKDLFKLLKKLPCDRTFTQEPRHKWLDNKELFHSLDLSSATDRFPIDLQAKLLSIIYDDREFGDHWKELLIDRSYVSPEGESYKYAVGQPMGAYSSWAAFTLTHHLVVAWAAYLSKLPPFDFDQYIILGDDIVIKNCRVSQHYSNIIKKLDVKISKEKTHVSKDTYEFAKRWIKGSDEITGLPLRAILNKLELTSLYNTISTYRQRVCAVGSSSNVTTISKSLHKISFKFLNQTKYLTKRKIEKLLFDLDALMRFNQGCSYNETRAYLAAKLGDSDYILPPEGLFRNYLRTLFAEIVSSKVLEYCINIETQITDLNDKLSMFHGVPTELVSNPLSEGLVAGMKQSYDRLVHLDEEDFDLIEQSLLVNHPDTDKLVQLFRNPSNTLNNACSIWRKMIKSMQEGLVQFPTSGGSLAKVHHEITSDGLEEERNPEFMIDYSSEDSWWQGIINSSSTYKDYNWNRALQVAYENNMERHRMMGEGECNEFSYDDY